MSEISNISKTENSNIEVDLEFLDHAFRLNVPRDIDLDELFEITEKYILENPELSIDLKALSKNILDTEYYNLIMKQNNNGLETKIANFDEIQIGIPLRIELESDSEKKRFFTKKHLKSTFQHIESISINELAMMFNISNLAQFKNNLLSVQDQYPITIENDVILLTHPFSKIELKKFINQLLDFMSD